MFTRKVCFINFEVKSQIMIKFHHLILLICTFILAGCVKEGTGGKASVSGHVMHHDDQIPNAIVYIKYGAEEFPGADVASYDASIKASASEGEYEFEDLRKGHYYLYSVGYDSAIANTVKGGVGIRFKKKDEMLHVNVPVTE